MMAYRPPAPRATGGRGGLWKDGTEYMPTQFLSLFATTVASTAIVLSGWICSAPAMAEDASGAVKGGFEGGTVEDLIIEIDREPQDVVEAMQALQRRRDAIESLRQAAEDGHAAAQAKLGLLHMFGDDDVPLSPEKAVRWSRRAAEQGNADAQSLLGYAYSIGRGVPQDAREAVRWLRPAAEQGNPDAQYRLGRMYERGLGVVADDAEAQRWFRQAAEQGHADAQDRLDVAYSAKREVPQDERDAVQQLRRAAEQGDVDAQAELGLAYYLGNSVKKDEEKAERWFRQAAEQGQADAQFGLGSLYLSGGRGVRSSAVGAHMWLSIALSNGTGQARAATLMKRLVESRMTPAQMRRATRRARKCMESNYRSCRP